MEKKKILFVCVHNSARSQMAEAFVNTLGAEHFEAESAGLKPGILNPIVIKAMAEEAIDISQNKSDSVREFLNAGKAYDYVITVCDEASAEVCPNFPGGGQKFHWGFSDPSGLAGSDEQKFAQTRVIRDAIKSRVENWLMENNL